MSAKQGMNEGTSTQQTKQQQQQIQPLPLPLWYYTAQTKLHIVRQQIKQLEDRMEHMHWGMEDALHASALLDRAEKYAKRLVKIMNRARGMK